MNEADARADIAAALCGLPVFETPYLKRGQIVLMSFPKIAAPDSDEPDIFGRMQDYVLIGTGTCVPDLLLDARVRLRKRRMKRQRRAKIKADNAKRAGGVK